MPKRYIFKFGSHELTPTLEEYARISGLSLFGPCARVIVGHMRRQFLTAMGLTWATLLSEVTGGCIVSLDFIIDRFGSSGSFIAFRDDFGGLEDK